MRTGHGAGSRAAEADGHTRDRSCTGRAEGSHEGRHGRGRPHSDAEEGSRPRAAVRGAEANGSLPSCHHNSPYEGAGCAHGTHPDSHPDGGCTHAAGRADRSHPREAGKDGAGSANELGYP